MALAARCTSSPVLKRQTARPAVRVNVARKAVVVKAQKAEQVSSVAGAGIRIGPARGLASSQKKAIIGGVRLGRWRLGRANQGLPLQRHPASEAVGGCVGTAQASGIRHSDSVAALMGQLWSSELQTANSLSIFCGEHQMLLGDIAGHAARRDSCTQQPWHQQRSQQRG